MGKAIVRLADDAFVEWSTVVDAPVDWVRTRKEAESLWGAERVGRALNNGHSFVDIGPDPHYAMCNRAGPGEECITVAAIVRRFTAGPEYDQPLREGELHDCDWNREEDE